MKSLPPHYSWLPFSASRSVRFFYLTPSRSNFTPSVGPPLHFSVHRFAIPSFSAPLLLHLKYKRPFDSFSKQTDFISFSFFFLSLLPHLYQSLFSLLYTQVHIQTHTERHTRAQTETEREKEWVHSSWALLGWIGSFICMKIDGE